MNKKGSAMRAAMFRRRAISYLVSKKGRFEACPSNSLIVNLLKEDETIPESLKSKFLLGKNSYHPAFIEFFDGLGRAKKPEPKTYGGRRVRTAVLGNEFYNTPEWKRLRYRVLQHYGARCMCCGSSAKDGAKIHVDHIKPKSLYPELSLDFDNCQILCEPCNMGKSNLYENDWRDVS